MIIAGQLAPRWGLLPTFELYASAVIVLAAAGALMQAVLARGDVRIEAVRTDA